LDAEITPDNASQPLRSLAPESALPRRPVPEVDDVRLALTGLDAEEVAARITAGLTNDLPRGSSRSLWHILRSNLFTVFNAVVGAGTALLLTFGDWQDAIFGLAALANVSIGVVQEFRAKRLLDSLALLSTPVARVMRSGSIAEIGARHVVLDDLLVLRAGDQVVADAVILNEVGIEIDESLLTGESDAVPKAPDDKVLSGSAVSAGQGTARVVQVGAGSFSSRLTAEAKRFSLVNSELRNAANRIVRWVTWALAPLIALVLNAQMQAQGGWNVAIESGGWRQALIGTVSSAASVIPQGLVLMTSIAFTLAAAKLARSQVLVQEIAAIEILARVDVICFDKTGTLTDGEIVFNAIHETGVTPAAGWQQILGWIGADDNANATARCLRDVYVSDGAVSPQFTVPFSSDRKWSALSVADGPARGTWVFGAPEVILPPGEEAYSATAAAVSRLATQGLRTLVLARTEHLLSSRDATAERLPGRLIPVILITFTEKIRPDAAPTLAFFEEQRVGMRVISGDNPETVAAIARKVGLAFDGDGYDARDLPSDPIELGDVMERQLVFGRVTPMQKREMVAALQQRGHVVAMTGDGVNDALALKRADIGIAMGSGAAATRALSRMVLLDGQFARLPGVVAEGRRVITNIERVSKLFLTKTVYAVLLSLTVGVLLWKFPFLPRQFAPADGLTIGIPAFFLALSSAGYRYRPGFLRRSLTFSIPTGVVTCAVIVVVVAHGRVTGGHSERELQTAAAIALSAVGLWVLVVVARPLTWRSMLLIAAMVLALAGCLAVPLLRDYLDFELPSRTLLPVAIGVALIGCLGIEVVHRFLSLPPLVTVVTRRVVE
jgi:cation-transporting ATPase E